MNHRIFGDALEWNKNTVRVGFFGEHAQFESVFLANGKVI